MRGTPRFSFSSVSMVRGFLTDPTLEFPDVFVAEVRAASADFDVSAQDRSERPECYSGFPALSSFFHGEGSP
ncbi:hypothetical protein [Kaistia defluvii]|uniref:Uncharacterized protein n=1 Tax=Kaistia defluvii TaxID=410841 RepID=A0ABV2QWZ2_9HYPH